MIQKAWVWKICVVPKQLIPIVSLCLLLGCSSTGWRSEVRHVERYLGTDSATHEFQYHIGAEDRQTLALAFDGMLLSFEKSSRELVTQPGQEQPPILLPKGRKAELFSARDAFTKRPDAYLSQLQEDDFHMPRKAENSKSTSALARREAPDGECSKSQLTSAEELPVHEKINCSFMRWQSRKNVSMPDGWGKQLLSRLDDRNRLYLSQVFESHLEPLPIPYQNNRIRFNIYPSTRHLSAAGRGIDPPSSWLGLIRCLPIAGVNAVRESLDFHERGCGIADEYRSPFTPLSIGAKHDDSSHQESNPNCNDQYESKPHTVNPYQCWLYKGNLIHGNILSFGHAFLEIELPRLLRDRLLQAAGEKRPYSHIVVISMGWNTNQLESVENFNSLVRHTLDAQRARYEKGGPCSHDETCDFRPYVIGLTWPSAWTFETGLVAAGRKAASVITKAYDADELGATWYARLIHVTLPNAINLFQAATWSNIPGPIAPHVVLLGHSFGARALTLADASCPFYRVLEDCVENPSVSLAISLNGAFARARYYPTDADGVPTDSNAKPISLLGFNDGAPFHPYHLTRTNPERASWHVNFWSRWDSATSVELPGASTAFAGGSGHLDADKKLLESVSTQIACGDFLRGIYLRVSRGPTDVSPENQKLACRLARDACASPSVLYPCEDDAYGLPKTSLKEMLSSAVKTSKRLIFVDASGVVRHSTPLHAGNAHSDIYKWEVGEMIYSAITTLAPTRK